MRWFFLIFLQLNKTDHNSPPFFSSLFLMNTWRLEAVCKGGCRKDTYIINVELTHWSLHSKTNKQTNKVGHKPTPQLPQHTHTLTKTERCRFSIASPPICISRGFFYSMKRKYFSSSAPEPLRGKKKEKPERTFFLLLCFPLSFSSFESSVHTLCATALHGISKISHDFLSLFSLSLSSSPSFPFIFFLQKQRRPSSFLSFFFCLSIWLH